MPSPLFGLLPEPGLVMGQLSCLNRTHSNNTHFAMVLARPLSSPKEESGPLGSKQQGSLEIIKEERLSPKYTYQNFVSNRKKKT
jgi:hypothetical protein